MQTEIKTQSLESLLERVSSAEGPDRELDARIWAELNGFDVREERNAIIARNRINTFNEFDLGYIDSGQFSRHFRMAYRHTAVPAYSASLDACEALMRVVLPGAKWAKYWEGEFITWKPGWKSDGACSAIQSPLATDCLTFLAAILSALIAKGGADV